MRTLAEGLRLYQEERYEEAARRLQVVCEFEPDNVQAWLYYGATLGKLDHWPNAVAAFERVVALQPEQASGYFNLAQAHLRCGDAVAAEVAISHVLALEPANPAAEALRDEIAAALAPKPAEPAPPPGPTTRPRPVGIGEPAPPPAAAPAPRRQPLPYLLGVLVVLLAAVLVLQLRRIGADNRRLESAASLLDDARDTATELARHRGEDFRLLDGARAQRDKADELLSAYAGEVIAEVVWLRARVAWERDHDGPGADMDLVDALARLEDVPAEQRRLAGRTAGELRAECLRLRAEIALSAGRLDSADNLARQAASLAPAPADIALGRAIEQARAKATP